jgi:signal transduction histidine kinase
VQDEGMGIPDDMREKIFERFERAVSASNISGLGLGLYIARQIVDAHHGSIRVESEPGRGSRFIVDLPAASRAEKTMSGA